MRRRARPQQLRCARPLQLRPTTIDHARPQQLRHAQPQQRVITAAAPRRQACRGDHRPRNAAVAVTVVVSTVFFQQPTHVLHTWELS